jgi:hypothetical protein
MLNQYLSWNRRPTSFRSFTALKRLSLPLEAVYPASSGLTLCAINEAFPSGLEELYNYRGDHRFGMWLQALCEHGTICPSLKLLTLVIRSCWRISKLESIPPPFLHWFAETVAKTGLDVRVIDDKV